VQNLPDIGETGVARGKKDVQRNRTAELHAIRSRKTVRQRRGLRDVQPKERKSEEEGEKPAAALTKRNQA